MQNNQISASYLMDRLKESTRSAHDSAESSRFQGDLAKGVLPQAIYVNYLEQMYLVHGKLEYEIGRHEKLSSEVVTAEQMQEPILKEDLQFFGRQPAKIVALPSTTALLQNIEATSKQCPAALLGMHYVLFGSKHGGKFIARTCQKTYQLTDGKGVSYFDPYGNRFQTIWKDFKEAMNNLQLHESEVESICDAAAGMFRSIGEIGDALLPGK